jgi:D-lactate dehydrogenase
MWRVKELADPAGVLGPGVVLSRDPGVHLRNLKTTPEIPDEQATTCVECGFCEPVCPSRWLTTTPRQRIVIMRELARQPEGAPVREALLEQYEYDGIQTCAADGTCRVVCPLGIDTGKMVKTLRAQEHAPRSERGGALAAKRWRTQERAARAALRLGHAAGDGPARALSRAARRVISPELLPEWVEPMPPPAQALPDTAREGAAAVYFPSCVNRMFGSPRGSLPAALVAVSERAGLPLWIPGEVPGHCCGTPWSSKGYRQGHELKTAELAEALWGWTEEGRLPVVIDASSCTHGVVEEVLPRLGEERTLEVLDSLAWARDRLLPSLEVRRRVGSAAIHPTYSTLHLGLAGTLEDLVGALAEETFVPPKATCCGFAGDRGFLHPELTESATREEREHLDGREFDAYVSSNRTCEIGMERTTGRPYDNAILLLEELTR